MNAVALLSINEAPPEARLTLYTVHAGRPIVYRGLAVFRGYVVGGCETPFENANRSRRGSYEIFTRSSPLVSDL